MMPWVTMRPVVGRVRPSTFIREPAPSGKGILNAPCWFDRLASRVTRIRRILRVLSYGLASVFVLVLIATAAERVLWRGKVLPGVKLLGATVDGMGADSLGDSVAAAAARLETEPIEIRVDTRKLTLDPRRIGLDVDSDDTAEAVQAAGRSGNPFGQILGTVGRLFTAEEVHWDLTFDEAAVDAVLEEWAKEVAVEPQDGTLEFDGATVMPVQPKAGRELSRPAADRVLVAALREGFAGAVTLPANVDRPDITRAEVDAAAAEARKLLTAPIAVTIDTVRVTLVPADLGSALRTEEKDGKLKLRVDHDKLREIMGPDVAALEGPPRDAEFSVDGARVSIVPHQVGRVVDMEDLEEKVLAGGPNVAGIFKEEIPEKTTEELEALHIEEMIASFTTNYPAGQPRVKNIQKAAGIVDGTIVPSGSTFSLNDALGGKRKAADGWVVAPVIEAGEYSEALGGGISQFATTMFNAAFFGGFPLPEYKAHTFYISRYPMGREATVSYPSPDLKWVNDTNHAVLIRTSGGATSVTVNFYSRKIRNVTATPPEVLEVIPPPEEIVVDLAVPRGTNKVQEEGAEGFLVKVRRITKDLDGNEIGNRAFTTRYKPQKRIVAYHPCDHPDPAKRTPPEAPECAAPPPETTTTTIPAGAGPP